MDNFQEDEVIVQPEENVQKRVEINESNPSVLLACYGTLRLGRGNYHALLEGKSEHLGTYKTNKCYTMYGKNAGFPIVVDEGETAIEYDLFRVTSPTVLNRVHSLEGCTGIPGHPENWYDIQEIETPHGIAHMYVQHDISNTWSSRGIITSGNWNNR